MKTSALVVGPIPYHLKPVFEKHCLVEQELLVGIRYSNKHMFSSGKCYFKPGGKIPHKITLVLGQYEPDHTLVALHEIAHAMGPHAKHDKAFWNTAIKYYEAESIPKQFYYTREATYRTGFLEMAYDLFGDCPEYRLGYLARVIYGFMVFVKGTLSWRRDFKRSVLVKELLGANICPLSPRDPNSSLGIMNDMFFGGSELVVFETREQADEVATKLSQISLPGLIESRFEGISQAGGWGIRKC